VRANDQTRYLRIKRMDRSESNWSDELFENQMDG